MNKKKEEKGATKKDLTFFDENDVLNILLRKMQVQYTQLKEQEIAIVKGKALALIEGEDRERTRVSREIHDSIGQMLTAIKLATNQIQGQDELKSDIKNMINETISEVRRISFDLMPSVLINLGLISSVKILCENIEKYGNISVVQLYDDEISSTIMSLEKSIPIYRIIQESFNNILKYSKAKNVLIKIEKKINYISVSIKDDGIGFLEKDFTNLKKGKGLINMKQRAELCNGKFKIESSPKNGTEIEFTIPI